MGATREAAVWRLIADHGPTPAAQCVLHALAAHADSAGRCWPSIERMAAMTHLARSSVKAGIGFWKAAGVLVSTSGGGRGRASVYVLPALADPEKGPVSGPFSARKGPVSGLNAPQKRADLDPRKGPMIGPQPKREPEERARAYESGSGDDLRAQRLADAVKRGGPEALVLDTWKSRRVAELAVSRYGANASTLRAAGCDIEAEPRSGFEESIVVAMRWPRRRP